MANDHTRILSLEDNPLDGELIDRELLRAKLSFSVTRIDSEASFRHELETSDPDVILADYNLPGFDGISALKIAGTLVPETPFIFVSGSIGEERAVHALREGASDYVMKDRLPRLASAITRAITERRERALRHNTQEALRRSEDRFQYAAQATHEVIGDLNVATRKIWFSEALRTVWGYELPEHEVDLDWWFDRIHPEDRDEVVSSFSRAQAAGEGRWTCEYRFACADGSFGYVRNDAVIIYDAEKNPTRVVCAKHDITDKTLALKKLQQSELRFRSVAKTATDAIRQNELLLTYAAEGIYGLDRAGKVTFVNPAVLKFSGWSRKELLAAPSIHDVLHGRKPDGAPYPAGECPMHQTLADGIVRNGRELFFRKTGEPFPVEFSCSPIYEESEITGCVTIFEDVGERLQLEQQVEQSRRISTLGHVAATIAHEFNNVLMGIQPFAEVIRRRANGDEKLTKAASQIISSVTRGKRVTQEILRFTQPAEPTMQTVDTEEWLRHLVPELRAMIGHRIELALELPRESVMIRCDAPQLQQVLTNLVLNARDAMSNGGKITITLSADRKRFSFGRVPAGMALLSVADTGSGMTPEVLENIFEPLFTTKRSGTGLGLAVAQQVVTRNGGSIHVESAPGRGTTFYVTIPLGEASLGATEVAPPRTSLRVTRVLLVEDEPVVVAGIRTLLEIEGIEVAVAERGAEAMPTADSFRPEAVILDLSLPDMQGTEVYERLAARWPNLPVIFSTGHGDEAALERYLSAPHVGFLRKPYDFDTLTAMLQKVSERGERNAQDTVPA